MGEIVRLDLARAIVAGLELRNARWRRYRSRSPDVPCRAKGDGDRQPDIAETDDGELSTVRHDLDLAPLQMRASLPLRCRHSQWSWRNTVCILRMPCSNADP